jgi:hypothetical protein
VWAYDVAETRNVRSTRYARTDRTRLTRWGGLRSVDSIPEASTLTIPRPGQGLAAQYPGRSNLMHIPRGGPSLCSTGYPPNAYACSSDPSGETRSHSRSAWRAGARVALRHVTTRVWSKFRSRATGHHPGVSKWITAAENRGDCRLSTSDGRPVRPHPVPPCSLDSGGQEGMLQSPGRSQQ